MIDIKLLEQLCLCNGISGDEGNVRNLIINEIKDCADDIKTDNLQKANLWCRHIWMK